MLLLDAFNKDRASLPQPLTNAQTPLPAAVPDARIQEMINEKLKKAEDLGNFYFVYFPNSWPLLIISIIVEIHNII